MRQRKIKNLDMKLEAFRRLWTESPKEYKGHWREYVLDDISVARSERASVSAADRDATSVTAAQVPLYVEIGCGKGQFITRSAARKPEAAFLAFEGHRSVALHALEKISAVELSNARLVLQYVNDLSDIFADGEVDGIYLNFSDPWPKDRHAKRRLTSENRLTEYGRVVAPGGFLEFRTDNENLFAYSQEKIYETDAFQIEYVTHDLHADAAADPNDLITTEYEDKFSGAGKAIHFLRAVRKN